MIVTAELEVISSRGREIGNSVVRILLICFNDCYNEAIPI